ncbi:sugar phosphate isomerase/epimerase family protein [Nocardioides zhouii]|uniref:Sugar phosphate isomerase/epimerase n=1 Tax=Nocardioides zhouii TaxID=1168729 RepID=A0A4Q2T5P1_9ACTN|nr:TIM barrel protein [Nocardioides zhouii]RYC13363.1 sugar phosphate isomerase/epimerase [Nocardioides zhouii]
MNTPDIRSTETPALMRRLGLNRRQLLAASTGVAAASMVGPLSSPAAAAGKGVLIPRGKLGIILYSVRDAISRDPNAFDVPSGFKEVFAELAKIGYKQIEFAGYTQNVNAEGGRTPAPALLKQWLDDNGLEAEGNHGSIPSTITDATLATFDAACEAANVLGMGHIGTGSDPTGSAYLADWQLAADRWNILGERAMNKHGLKLYTHNHDIAYSHLIDSGPLDVQGRPTRSSGVRRLEWFMNNTDSRYVFLEMDIYWAHVAQYKHRSYVAADGTVVADDFDPLGTVNAYGPMRFPLFHAKDGASRPGTSNGYDIVPFGAGNIDYVKFLGGVGAKGYHNPMWEQDTAPSANIPGTQTPITPGQSLAYAQYSFDNLAKLRG